MSTRLLPRPALLARILGAPGPLVVIEAPAGTGKSVLLAALSQTAGLPLASGTTPPAAGLWDVPGVAQTAPLPPDARLILAKRPETAIPGLARARVYGRVSEFTADDLLFARAELVAAGLAPDLAAEVMMRSGGWACLLPAVVDTRAAPEVLVNFLHDEILAHYPSAAIAALGAHLTEPLRRFEPHLLAGLPFAHPGAALHPSLAAIRAPLQRAITQVLTERARDPNEARAIEVMPAALSRLPEAIATLSRRGRMAGRAGGAAAGGRAVLSATLRPRGDRTDTGRFLRRR